MEGLMRQQEADQWAALSASLRRSAVSLTGSPEEAEKLTQQTLAHLLARRPEKASHMGFARKTMFRLWLDRQ